MNIIEIIDLEKNFYFYKNRFKKFLYLFFPFANLSKAFKALSDINICFKRGETIGIIGINGAGKSTLLKCISGVIKPSSGQIIVKGKVTSILDLGFGFHRDLTGRENCFIVGQIFGLSSRLINESISEIKDFSEIGDFFDKPIKYYSTGMLARLAFSLATVHRPDILIIDETLSVGDIYFQQKSFKKIKEFKDKGTTLLITSHDKQIISLICDRVILLDKGQIIKEGTPEFVLNFYNSFITNDNRNIKISNINDEKIKIISGNNLAQVIEINSFNLNNQITSTFDIGDKIILNVKVIVNNNLKKLVLGYSIRDRLGQVIFGTNTALSNQIISDVKKNTIIYFKIELNCNLAAGNYSISTALCDEENHLKNNYQWQDNIIQFQILDSASKKFEGYCFLDNKINYKREIYEN
jgi:lipopolysaccharide transport system ATP-binding protein